ncbi:hypothetical protein K491DRAFT_717108 [Lophiostoma macrostomum CBS 122681]|uniref:CFEM domain-containing protein n=1 Tax=Lophiostoma macrostomum CBS 122681 TaxID=1314788 RepID=A0A6A6T414_9PLEO|nr:hypothetical protein K491DRAFT_717108 [Lophiostoma macrostomum CBS 122681]
MPSLTSIVTTTLLTITTLIPTTTCFPQSDIFGPIEGLSQCAQTIIFTDIADSQCNPANFPCICDELVRLNVGAQISSTCTVDETAQYNSFVSSICPNNRQPTQPPSTSVNISTPIPPVSTPAPIPIITGVPTPNTTNVTIPVGPFVNTTITLVAPTETTAEILIPTTDVNGQPTTVTSHAVSPVQPTGPAEPGFSGAAGKVEVGFGYARTGLMAGGIGIMGLVFAEL